jgi:hypothetical protein
MGTGPTDLGGERVGVPFPSAYVSAQSTHSLHRAQEQGLLTSKDRP